MKVFFIKGFWIALLFGGSLSQAAINMDPEDAQERMKAGPASSSIAPETRDGGDSFRAEAEFSAAAPETPEDAEAKKAEDLKLSSKEGEAPHLKKDSPGFSKAKPKLEEAVEVLMRKNIQTIEEYLEKRPTDPELQELPENLLAAYNIKWSDIQNLSELDGEKLDRELLSYLMGFVGHVDKGKGRIIKVLFEEWRRQIVEKIQARASNIMELDTQLVKESLLRQNSMETNIILFVEAKKLREKAIDAGGKIQLELGYYPQIPLSGIYNLYEAQAEMADFHSEERLILDTEENIAQIILSKSKRTEDKSERERMEKYMEYIKRLREERRYALFKISADLHKALAAQYAIAGQQEKSEKYEESAEHLTTASVIESQANIHKTTGNRKQIVGSLTEMADKIYDLHFKDEAVKIWVTTNNGDFYLKEAMRYSDVKQTAIAEKYAEAYALTLKAVVLQPLSSPEETKERIAASEKAAEEAARMAASFEKAAKEEAANGSSCQNSLAGL